MGRYVKPIALMDDETLLKHINARHTPLAGLEPVLPYAPGETTLRAYHEVIHRLGREQTTHTTDREVNHTHRNQESE